MKKLAIWLIFIMLTNLFFVLPIKSEDSIIEKWGYDVVWINNQQKKDYSPIIDVNLSITMPYEVLNGYINIYIKQIYPEETAWSIVIKDEYISLSKPIYECWRAQKDFYIALRAGDTGIYQVKATLLIEKIVDQKIQKYLYLGNTQDFFVNQRRPYFLETPQEDKPIVAIENMFVIQRTENVLFRMKLKPQDINFQDTFFFIDVYNNTLPLLSYKLGQIKESANYNDFVFDWVAPKTLFSDNHNTLLTFKLRTVEHEKESPIALYGKNIGELIIAPKQ